MKRQKLYGAILVACGLASASLDGDITAAMVLVPLGLWLVLSRQNLLYGGRRR